MSERTTKEAQDLLDLWDQHLASEFGAKDAARALSTMTDHPRVNIIPLMIGGSTREEIEEFYAHNFLSQIPPDIEIITISRTAGQGRVVDELVMRCTHSIQMDWILPGIPATGKRLELPFVVVVQFEGTKIAHEHLYWDEASLLLQIGLIDPSLPVVGAESARQLLSPTLPMNGLLRRKRAPAPAPPEAPRAPAPRPAEPSPSSAGVQPVLSVAASGPRAP